MRKQEIECPHCKLSFPIPTRRHYFSTTARFGTAGTLCGLEDAHGKLIAKDGETVNCKVCLKRRAKGKV